MNPRSLNNPRKNARKVNSRTLSHPEIRANLDEIQTMQNRLLSFLSMSATADAPGRWYPYGSVLS